MSGIVKLMTVVLVALIACTGCSDGDQDGATLTKTASVERNAGSVPPTMRYQDAISLTGRTLRVTRTGGASVITGTWTVILNNAEVGRLNQALAVITMPADADSIPVGPAGPFPVGGGIRHIVVDGTGTFHSGVIVGDGLHEFSADVEALYDVVIDLLMDRGLDVVYTGSV